MGITSNELVTDDDIEEKLQSSIGTLSDDHTILVKNNIIVINYSADNPGVFRIVFNLLNTSNKSNNILDLYSFGDGNVQGVLSNYTDAIIGSSTALLMLFIKENSDRCHYYNGKWNKKDLAIGISSIILGSIAKYFITLI